MSLYNPFDFTSVFPRHTLLDEGFFNDLFRQLSHEETTTRKKLAEHPETFVVDARVDDEVSVRVSDDGKTIEVTSTGTVGGLQHSARRTVVSSIGFDTDKVRAQRGEDGTVVVYAPEIRTTTTIDGQKFHEIKVEGATSGNELEQGAEKSSDSSASVEDEPKGKKTSAKQTTRRTKK